MSNNVAAILNSDMAAIWWQFPHGKHYPRYKESLFSFQIATGSEIQLPYWNPIWRPLDVNSDIAKMFVDIDNIGIDTWMLVIGAIEQEMLAKLWSLWRHIGNQYGGHQGSRIFGVYFFNDLYVLKNTCAKCHAFFKNCTILVKNLP